MTTPDTDACEHDWHLPDPGRAWSAESPWEIFCPRCGVTDVASCHCCTAAPALPGSNFCAPCRQRVRRELPTFEQMLGHPFTQPDVDSIVYKNVIPATALSGLTRTCHELAIKVLSFPSAPQ